MKRALLILPSARPSMAAVSQGRPLTLCHFLGSPVLDHALRAVAEDQATHVTIVVRDGFEAIHDYVSDGNPWGLTIDLVDGRLDAGQGDVSPRQPEYADGMVHYLDALPQAPHVPIFESAAAWHRAHAELAPILMPNVVGMREVKPGVWVSLQASVSKGAQLVAPCCIGKDTQVNAGATVGPNACVEAACIIDSEAQIVDSTVAEATYVGSLTSIHGSIASGASLLNWRNDSLTEVTDSFLLAPMASSSLSFKQRLVCLLLTPWAKCSSRLRQLIRLRMTRCSLSVPRGAH